MLYKYTTQISVGFCVFFAFTSKISAFELQIVERGTKNEIAYANLYLLPSGEELTSDEMGKLKIESSDFIEIKILTEAYDELIIKKENLSSNKINKFYLSPQSNRAFESTVYGVKRKDEPAQQSLAKEFFLKTPGSGGDPVRAVENLPGVIQSIDSRVAIQGSPPEYTKYMINGQEVPILFHFFGLNSVVVPEAVDQVDFLSAGFGPKYGRAIGGLVNLEIKDPNSTKHRGLGYVDFLNTAALYEGPVGDNQSLLIGGRYSYVGLVLSLVQDSIASDEGDDPGPPQFNTAPYYGDFVAHYVYEPKKDKKLKLSFVGSRDFAKSLNTQTDDFTFTGDIRGRTQFFRLLGDYQLKSLNLKSSLGYDQVLFEPGSQVTERNALNFTQTTEIKITLNEKTNLVYGTDLKLDYSANRDRLSSSFLVDESEVGVPQAAGDIIAAEESGFQGNLALFAQLNYKKNETWTLSPGLRLDYFSKHQSLFAGPRFKLKSTLNKEHSLFFLTGLYAQAAEFRDLTDSLGNPNLGLSKALHFKTSWVFEPEKQYGINSQVGAFLKRPWDLKRNSTAQVLRDGLSVPERFTNNKSALIYGLESLITYNQPQYFVNLGYTLTVSRIFEDGLSLPSPQDQRHNLNMNGGLNWGSWRIGSRVRWVSGTPYTPIIDGVYVSNSDSYYPIPGDRFSKRLGAFFSWDLRVDKQWRFQTWILSFYLDIQNVLNTANDIGPAYSFDFQKSGVSTGLPILPTFGVKGEF